MLSKESTLFGNFFSSVASLRSTFFASSSGGRSSGFMFRLPSRSLTSRLLLTCSPVISCSVAKSSRLILKFVISLAKSLALIVIMGKKSAKALFSGIFSLRFMSFVFIPPNKAVSPLLRMRPKLFWSPTLSKIIPDNSFSEAVSRFLASSLSTSAMRFSISSCFLVCTAKYVCANAISSFDGSPFCAIR